MENIIEIENNNVENQAIGIQNLRLLKYENIKPSSALFNSNEFRHDVEQVLGFIDWDKQSDVTYKTISTSVQNLLITYLNLDLQYTRMNINGLTPDYYDGKLLIEFKVYPFEIPNSLVEQFEDQALKPYEHIDCIKRAKIIDISDRTGKIFPYDEWLVIKLLLSSFSEVYPMDDVEKLFEKTAKRIFQLPEDAEKMIENFDIKIGKFHIDRFKILPKVLDSITPHISDVSSLEVKLDKMITKRNENTGLKYKLLTKYPLNVECDNFKPVRVNEIPTIEEKGSRQLGFECFKIFNNLFENGVFEKVEKLRKLIGVYTSAKETKTVPQGFLNLDKLSEVIEKEKKYIETLSIKPIKVTLNGDICYSIEEKLLTEIGVNRRNLMKEKYRYYKSEKVEELQELLNKQEKKIRETKEIKIKPYLEDLELFFDNCIFEPKYEFQVRGTTFFNNSFTNHYGLKMNDEAVKTQEKLLETKYMKALTAQREFNDLITANTSLDYKNRMDDAFTICNFFYNKEMNIGGVIFPADNMYTGAIFLFGKLFRHIDSPEFNKIDIFQTSRGDYFITKSFSLRRAQLKDNMRNFGSALNTFTAWNHFKMNPNATLMSLFFDPEKELTNLFDLTFYLAKMSGFSFGEILVEDKLDDIKFYKKSVANFFAIFMKDFRTLAENTGSIYLREIIQPIHLKGFNFMLNNHFQHSLITWIKNNMPKEILISNRSLITYQWKANIKYKDDYKNFKDSWYYEDVTKFYKRDKINVKSFPEQIITEGIYNQTTSYLPGATHALNVYTSLKHIQQIDYYLYSRVENIGLNNDGKIGQICWKNSIAIKNSIENSNTNSINVLKEGNLQSLNKFANMNDTFTTTNMIKNRKLDFDLFEENELKRLTKQTLEDEHVKEIMKEVEEEVNEVMEELMEEIDIDVEDIGHVRLKQKFSKRKNNYKPPLYLGFESQKNKNVEFARQMNVIQHKSMKLQGNAFVLASEVAYFFDLHLIPQMLLVEQDMDTYFINSGATFSEKVQTSGEKKRIFSVMFPHNRALHQIADDLCGQKLKLNKHSNITIGGHRKLLDFQELVRFGFSSTGIIEDARRHGERIWQEHVTEKQISDRILGKMTVGQMNCVVASSLSMWNRKMIIPHLIVNGLIRDKKLVTETLYSHTEQGKLLFEKIKKTELLINNYKHEPSTKFYNDTGKVGNSVFNLNPSFSSFIGYPLGVMSKNVTDTHALIGQLLECDSLLGFGERVTASRHHSDDSFDKLETKYPTSDEFKACATGGKWEKAFQSFLVDFRTIVNDNLNKILLLQNVNAVVAATEIKKFKFANFNRQTDKIIFPNKNSYPSVFFSIYSILARITYSRMICITPSLFKYMITRVIVEKIQVMLMNIRTANGKNVVDVYSPLNKFLDSVGNSANVLSLNMAITQKMGMLMEASLHDMPEKLFFELQYNVNYLSAYEFRVPVLYVDRPIQLFGYYFTTIPLLQIYGLTSDLLRKASTRFGLSLYSKLLNIKTEVINKTTNQKDAYTQLSVVDEKYGASMVLRDFIISCSSGKNIQRAQAKLLEYVNKETLAEAEEFIESKVGSAVLYKRDNAAIALLHQCKSAKSLDNFKMSLRKVMVRKLGYKNSTVNVNGKAWSLSKLVEDLTKDLNIVESNDFKIFQRFYDQEIAYFTVLEIKFVKVVDKPLFLGQYSMIVRDNPFKYRWDEIMPTIVCAIELGGIVYQKSIKELRNDIKLLEVWKYHPELTTDKYLGTWEITVGLLKSLSYKLDNKEEKQKLIKDCEFIKKIITSYTTPAIAKQSLLTTNNVLNRSIDFYTVDSGNILILESGKSEKTFIMQRQKIDIDIALNSMKYEDIITLMIHFNYNPETLEYFKDNQMISSHDLKSIAGRLQMSMISEQKIKVNKMFAIVEHLILDEMFGQFKFGEIIQYYKKYDKETDSYLDEAFVLKCAAIKIGNLMVGVGCGYLGRNSKKELIFVNDKTVERKNGIFILHNSREHNLTAVINLALIISYYSQKEKINEFYQWCKKLGLKETYQWLIRNNIAYTKGKNTPMMMKLRDNSQKFKMTEKSVIYSRGDYTFTPNGNKVDFTYEMQTHKLPIFYLRESEMIEIFHSEFDHKKTHFAYEENDIKLIIQPWFRFTSKFKAANIEEIKPFNRADLYGLTFFKLFLTEFCNYFLEIPYLDDDIITNEDLLLISIIEGITTINITSLYYLWMSTEEWRQTYNEEESYFFGKEIFLPFDVLRRSITTYGTYGIIEQRLEGLKSFVLTYLNLPAMDGIADHYDKIVQTSTYNRCSKLIRIEGPLKINKLTEDIAEKRKVFHADNLEFISYSRLISLLYIDGFFTRPEHAIFNYSFIQGFYKYTAISERAIDIKYADKLKIVPAVEVIEPMIEMYSIYQKEADEEESDEMGF